MLMNFKSRANSTQIQINDSDMKCHTFHLRMQFRSTFYHSRFPTKLLQNNREITPSKPPPQIMEATS